MCENPWSLNREPLVAEARGETIPHKVSDRHFVLLPSDSTSLTTYLEEHEKRFDVVTVDLPPLPNDLSQVAEATKWLHKSVGLFELAVSRLTDDGRMIVRVDDRSLGPVLALMPGLRLQRCIVWHNQSTGVNDANRLVVGVHDFFLVFGIEETESTPGAEYLSWKLVGMSGFRSDKWKRHLSDLGIPDETSIPKAFKPPSLYEWLSTELCSGIESFLDLTSCGGSWTHHLGTEVSKVDVVWADGDDGLVSVRLLLAKTGNRFDELDETLSRQRSLNGDFESGDCDCHIVRPPLIPPDPHPVRVARSHLHERAGVWGEVVATLRGSDGLALASFESHLSGHLDQLLIPVSVAVTNQPAVWSAMSRRGVLYLELDEDWPQHLAVLYAATNPESWLGTLVFRQGDAKFGPAEMVAVVAPNPGRSAEVSVGDLSSYSYEHDDRDPRGPWRAPHAHKGARSGTRGTSYTIYEPSYHWRLCEGETLPAGLWRVSREGFIWGTPVSEGLHQVMIEVEDADGTTSTEKLQIEISGPNSSESDDTDLMVSGGDDTWLFEGHRESEGPLKITTTSVTVCIGREVSIVLNAIGGHPFTGEIGPPGEPTTDGKRTRYWEWSKETLRGFLREDRLVWNERSGGRTVRPRPRGGKKYKSEDEPRGVEIQVARSVVDPSWSDTPGGIARWLRRHHPAVTTGSVTKAEDGVVLEVLSGSKMPAVELWLESCENCTQAGPPGGCNTAHSLDDLGLLRFSAEDETEQSWRAQLPDWLSFTVARDILGTQHVLVLEEAPLTDRLRAVIEDVVDPPVSLIACVRIGGNASSVPPHKRLAVG